MIRKERIMAHNRILDEILTKKNTWWNDWNRKWNDIQTNNNIIKWNDMRIRQKVKRGIDNKEESVPSCVSRRLSIWLTEYGSEQEVTDTMKELYSSSNPSKMASMWLDSETDAPTEKRELIIFLSLSKNSLTESVPFLRFRSWVLS